MGFSWRSSAALYAVSLAAVSAALIFAVPAHAQGVCDRTPEVREILRQISSVSDCADVTNRHLSGITGVLDLSNENIATLSAGDFSGLGNLRELDLRFNRLPTLPLGVFSGLGNLERLWLYSNQLSTLPAGVFSGLGNLELLHLFNNQLSTLPATVFSGLGNLERLWLHSNQLTALPVDVFSDLDNLSTLALSFNALATLPATVFSGLDSLESLFLSDNQLNTLPESLFSGLGNLELLWLFDNPGAPFVFARPRLEPTGTSPGPGVVEVKLVVDEMLPTTMTAALSAEGGVLSDSQAVIPRGSAESAIFTVTREAGAPGVTLRVSKGTLAGNFRGVETAPSERVLDFVGPSVSGVAIVSVPASGDAYRAADGEVIRVAVGFDEAVEASTTIAGPSLTLTIGETTRAATYTPDSSDVSTLVFTYALQAADADADGISIEEGALVLAGAEITDLFGNSIESTSLGSHAISDAAGHQVIRTFRLFFDPPAVTLIRGGGAETVVLRIEPELQDPEAVVVDLRDPAGLPGGLPAGLTVNPARVTLTSTSNEADVTVVAESTADLGEAELSATFDAGASVLGNARVTADSLTVEVVPPPVEASFEPDSLMLTTTEGAEVEVVVLLSPAPSMDVTVGYRIERHEADGYDPAEPADYSMPPGMVTIEAGETIAAIMIDINDDNEIEPPREAFKVVLEAPPEDAAYVLASPDRTTAIVVINEGVCDRTPQVRDVILGRISGVNDCADVTDARLSGITGTLDLRYRRGIVTLNAGDFSGLSNLRELRLDNDVLVTLPLGVFSDLGNLATLSLRSNRLSALPSGVFSGLGNLARLSLYNNQLSALPSGVFSGLGNLRDLDLRYNQLSILPSGIFSGLGNLATLSLNSNRLSTLPATVFSGLGNLETLYLHDNQLSTLPTGVFSGLGNLETLWLHNNALTTLPAGIFVGLTLSGLTLPPNVAFPLRFIPVDESGSPASARVTVGLAQGAPFEVSVDLFTVNARLSTNTALIPQGATQSEVFTVWRENPGEVVVVGFAGSTFARGGESHISDVFVMGAIGRSVVWIPSNLMGGVVSVREGATAMITVRAAPAPSEALTIGYGIDADGDDATADADGNDYTDVTGGTVTFGAGEASTTIEVRITDDEAIEAPREFFRVFLTAPPEDAAYVLASPDRTTAIVVINEGVCDRTPQVRDVILGRISGVNDCADVTDARLSGITGTLDLRYRRGIVTLNAGDFSGLSNLRELRLDNDVLVTLPLGVFSDLGNLATLSLRSNRLSALPSGVFSGLGNLARLSLYNNQLSALPSGVFSGLGNLRDLDLRYNQLSILPSGIFSGLGNLATLSLNSNRLSTLPATVFSGLGNLETLYLHDNQLSTLPTGVFSGLGNLETLWLHNNALTTLPAGIFVGLTLSGLTLPPNVAFPLRFIPVDESGSPASARVTVGLAQGAPFGVSVDLFTVNARLSTNTALIPQGATQSEVFTVWRENPGEVVVVGFAGSTFARGGESHISDVFVMGAIGRSVVWIPSNLMGGVVSVREGATAMITVRAAPVPSEALTIGYGIDADGDDATADADGNDYTDVTGGTVTFGAGEASTTIEVRITDDEAIEAPREFFRVFLTAPPEDAAYVLASPDRTTAIVVINEGVCDRTPQVRDVILGRISGVNDCADVTDARLSGITGTLDLRYRRGIVTLNAGDFSGLSNLRELRLDNDVLVTLPLGVFSDLGNLATLSLRSNRLSALPSGVFSGLGNLARLSLYNNQLSALPSGVFSGLGNLRDLDLRYNQLSILPSGIFSGLGNLATLSLNSNRLSTLPATVFSGLGNLETLYLHDNQLSTLPTGVFSGLGNLETLWLHNNALTTLPAGIFVGLTLSGLTLPPNVAFPLRFIPVDESGSPASARVTVGLAQGAPFGVSVDLFTVNARLSTNTALIPQGATQSEVFTVWRENPGEVVVVGFAGSTFARGGESHISDVFVMGVIGRSVVWIPSNLMGGVVSAREGATAMITVRAAPAPSEALTIGYGIDADGDDATADADGNDYTDVTGGMVTIGVGEASTTIEVRITDDEAIEAPREFFRVSLTAPPEDAAYVLASPDRTTAIVVINEGVCDRTPQVRDVILGRISGVNDCADVTDARLSGITGTLDLRYRRGIVTLNAGDFSGLSNLRELRLDNDVLVTLPLGVFSDLGNLATLSLRSNRLSALPSGVFSGLGNLARLSLYNNQLSALPSGVFSGLGNLRDLDLRYNQLSILPSGIFSGLGNLATLSLNSNRLSTLPATVFSGLGNLETLYLHDNQLSTLPTGVFSGLGNLQSLNLLNNPGVPFVFARPRLEPTGTSPEPGVVEVKLVVDEPLPTLMTAELSAEGGVLSGSQAVIPQGGAESVVFTVTREAGAPVVTLRVSTGTLTGSFSGVVTAPSERVLDFVGPSVSGVEIVSIPAFDDAYRAVDGEIIRVEVGFDEAVEVLTTIAGPSLTLTIGETTRAATYAPGLSEPSTLVFAYALQTSDADADGISIEEDALVLAGAEITDRFGNPIEDTSLGSHAILNAAGHQVIRTFRLFFDPPAVTLIRGGEAETVVLRIEPELQASEEVVVDLGDPQGLTGGLTVDPARATLTSTSNEADVTVAAESTAALGEAELSATFDAGASVLGNARVAADSLTVEVVLAAEASFEPDFLMLTTTEGAEVEVVVLLSPALSIDVTVAYRIERHEADGYDPAELADYSTPPGTVTVEAGETTAAIVIDINDDEEIEPTREAFKVVLEAPPEDAAYVLASSEQTAAIVVIKEGVCDRTEQVRDGILRLIGGVSDCADVTDDDLSGITGILDLRSMGIAVLSAGDFSGLVNLGQLWLHENDLTILPADVFSGLGSLEVLWLPFNDQLTTLPATVFSGLGKLEYLSLRDNQLTALPADVFKGLENLSTLVLSFNALTTLPATVFSSLGSLETLFISHNQLTTLPATVFSGLGNLSTLVLSFNALTTLPATVFSGLGNLQGLDLSNNPGAPFVFARPRLELTGTSPSPGVVEVKLVVDEPLPRTMMTADLSAEGGTLSDSQAVIPGGSTESAIFTVTQEAGAPVTLRASTGTLTRFFSGVVTAPSELVLDVVAPSVSGVEIVSVPASGDAYRAADSEVIRVEVGFDEAVEVSATIAGPSLMLMIGETARAASYVPGLSGDTTLVFAYALQAGDADADGISVEEDALVLSGAEITDLSGNPIENTSLGDHALLNVAGHRVIEGKESVCDRTEQVRDEILRHISGVDDCADVTDEHLSGIRSLSLRGIATLRAGDFSGLSNLEQLYLSSNQLITLPLGVFSGLGNLWRLDLQYNQLSILPTGVFSGLGNLEHLRLYNNALTTLPADVFSGLGNLGTLLLGGNQLSTLPSDVFSGLGNLDRLELHDNALTTLPATVFSGLGNLWELDLNDNQLSTLPSDVFSGLGNLDRLELHDNALTTLPAGIFVGLTLSRLTLPPNVAFPLRFIPVDESRSPASARVTVGLAQGAPFGVSVDLFTVNARLSTNTALIPQGATQSEVFTVWRENPGEVVVVGFAGSISDAPPDSGVEFNISDVFVMGDIGRSVVWIPSNPMGGVVSVREGATAVITVRAAPAPSEALTIGYGIDADGDDATADADGNDYTDVTGGMVTIGAGEASTTIEVRITDDEAIEAPREFFRVSLTAPPEDAAYVLASPDRTTAIVAIKEGVCDRTEQVRDEIVGRISGVNDCADVTDAHLSGIRSLSLRGIATLRAGDFSGLSNLEQLYLSSNQLITLPLGVFSGLGNLWRLDLQYNQLSILPTGVFSGLGNLEHLRLYNNALTTLPADVFSGLGNLGTLLLGGNQLSTLPSDVFSGLGNLDRLELHDNALTTLPATVFSGLGNLWELDLNDNQLSTLPSDVFSGLGNLDRLELHDNALTTLPAGIFVGLTLSRLTLPPNVAFPLRFIPVDESRSPASARVTVGLAQGAPFGVSVDLFTVNARLSTNTALIPQGATQSEVFTVWRENPGEVVVVGFAGSISDAPPDSGVEFNISDVFVMGDIGRSVVWIPSNPMGGVVSVREGATAVITVRAAPAPSEALTIGYGIDADGDDATADADGNDYTDVTGGMVTIGAGEASTTIEVRITDDEAIEAPREFFRVSLTAPPEDAAYVLASPDRTTAIVAIKEGVCDRTEQVRDEIVGRISGVNDCADVTDAHLSGIRSLSLRGIATLRAGDFSGLGNLATLSLRSNRLSALPLGVFSGLGNLWRLDLQYNQLSILPTGVFSGLGNLEHLRLYNNALTTLPADVFSGLGNLGTLLLGGNQLSTLPSDVFSGLGNLDRLELHDNALTTLPATVFSGLGNLWELDLNDNQLSTLPSDVFSGLGNLDRLELHDNPLSTLPAGVFVGLTLSRLTLPPNVAFPLRFIPVDESGSPASARVTVGLAQGAPFGVSVDLFTVNARLSTNTALIPQGATQSEVFTVWRENPGEVVVVGFAGSISDAPPDSGVEFNISDVFVMGDIGRSVVWIPSNLMGGVVSVREGATAVITVRAAPAPSEALTIGYGIDADGDDATADADGNDYTDVTGGMVTIGAGEASTTIEVRITDDEAIEAPREFFRVSLTAPPEDAAYVLASPDRTTAIVAIKEGVCDRTEQVRDEIVGRISGVNDCADVTDAHLSGIRSLSLRGIATLRAGDFSGLGNLATLSLRSNRLSALPLGVFSGLGNLWRLDLQYNQLSILPTGVFSGLGNLEHLRLYNNALTTLPVDVFSGLGNLGTLLLGGNQLSTLPSDVFSGLGNLDRLEIHDNALTTLPATVFSGLGNLWELDLNDNQLSTLPSDVFSGLGNLQSLNLSNNPGVPFVFARPRLEPTGTSPGPGVVEVKLVVDEPLPTLMTADLSVEGGVLSDSQAVIPQGSAESAIFTVAREAGAPVTLRASTGTLVGSFFGVVTAPSERVLDFIGPSVSGVEIVSIPISGDAYQALSGEIIRVAVGFNETVKVLTAIAVPWLTLTIGETTRAATYASGLSEPSTLVFAYALQAGDADADGISIGEDALVLAGAEITDLFGNPIENTSLGSHAISDAAGHQVIRTFRLFFDPPAVTLIRGGEATVVLRIEPELQDSEEVVVNLGGPRGLTGGLTGGLPGGLPAGLTVNPVRATLTSTSNEADVTVAAESTADLGEAELSATLDAGASVLGNARVMADSLTVEVSPPPVEASFEPDSLMMTTTEGAEVEVVVLLSPAPSLDVTVAYRIEGHEIDYDPAEPSDYSTPLGMVTVEAGETTAAILIDIINDEEAEPTREAFKVVLEAPPESAAYVLASPDRTTAIVVINEGVCDRTPQVQGGILSGLSGVVNDCADVTDDHLSGITGTLNLRDRGIATLKAGDFSGLSNLRELNLWDNQLSTLPAGVFSGLTNLEKLDLPSNQLSTLPTGVFSGLGNLEELYLWDNQLSTLPTGVFSGLGNLEVLYLWGNQLSTLPATVFSSLGNLEGLALWNNQLTTLPAGAFSGLGNFKRLNLNGNPLTTLPAGIFVGLTLDHLILPPNVALPLRFIPVDESGESASARVTVGLAQGAPFEVSVDLFAVNATLSANTVLIPQGATQSEVFTVWRENPGEVVVVGFAGATLDTPLDSEVAFNISDVSNVFVMGDIGRSVVWIPSNLTGGVVSVREGAAAMITVRAAPVPSEALTIGYGIDADGDDATADADGNDYVDGTGDVTGGTVTIGAGEESTTIEVRITDDEAIEALREFFRVSLTAPPEDAAYVLASPDRTTAIVVIKEGVCDRTPQVRGGIVWLISGVNDCAEVTDDHLSGITGTLNLRDRGIATLRAGDFSGLSNLRELNLWDNQLSTLPAGVFSGLTNLEKLDLPSNQLSTLPTGVFSGLGNLEELYLWGNQLSTLPATVFSSLGNLTELWLSDNQLSTLPATVFSSLGNLEGLALWNNQLTTLPAGAFSGLGNFKRLNLNGNPLTTLPAGIFVGLTLDHLILPPNVALPLRFIPVDESGESASARVTVGLAQGAPFEVSVDLFAVNATLSANTVLIPQGATQSEVFTVWRENPGEVVVVGFAGATLDTPLDSEVAFNISDVSNVFVMDGIGRSVVWIPSNLMGGVVSAREGETVMITVRAAPVPSEALTIGYGINADGDDATVDADEDDYADATGGTVTGTVTIGAGEESTTIEVRITDDEAIEAPREFFRVSLTAPPEDAAYILASPDQTTAIVVIKEGVCDRTPQVRDEIVGRISGVNDCADVTDGHLSGITGTLNLRDRGIATLRAGDFSGLGNLATLWLSGDDLTILPAGVFSGLDNLERLFLVRSQLSTLPATVFSGFGNLRELYLDNNQLSTLPSGVFSGLGNLERLELWSNQLSTLPVDVFSGLGNLDRLSLYGNQLSTLPSGVFSGLGNLEFFDLRENPGTPFVFARPRLEPTGTSPRHGVVEVKLVVDEPLPRTMMTADLSAEGGTLSDSQAVIPGGSTESAIFTVTQEAGAPVTLRASTGTLAGDFFGVETAPSELVLDVVGPSVSDVEIVSVPASGDGYRVADIEVIRVAVGFDEAVEASTTIAGPSLTLTIGETTRAASYAPDLSDVSTLVFVYALQAADADADGISIEEDALVLAGAEITDLFGNPIENTGLGSHAISDAAGHQVIRTFRLFFDPSVVTLVRGGEATVVLKIEPELQASEEVVVDLGGPRGLTGGLPGGLPAGLTVNPARVTLTPTSNEADVTVAAESTAALGEAELLATFDAGASVLGNARVTADSLTVEVVLPAEASFEPDSLMTTTTEGATATVVVSFSRELSEDVTVAYRIERHEADGYDPAEPADYSTPPGTVTIEAGATTAAIVIDINDDDEIEPTREAFKVILEAPLAGASYTLASPDRTTAIVVIKEGVCDRTPQVRDGIVRLIGGVSDCAEVTDDDLSGVSRVLDLSFMGIAVLRAGDFSGLGNLETLELHHNQLSTLPATVFSGLGNLEWLSLGNNQLSAWPAVFSGLGNLGYLLLQANRLTTLPAGVFSGLGNLKGLNLGDNQLSTLPATVFSNLGNLAQLTLRDNQLSTLPATIFSGLGNLVWLFLSSNQLSTLPATVFSGLGKLEWLDLQVNQLSALPADVFSGLGNLGSLDLRENPGAPFVFARPRLEPTGTSPGSGVVEVKLVVDEPLPRTMMTAGLSAEGGVLSDSQAVIPEGSTESAIFTVTQEAGAPVTLRVSTGTLAGNFSGVVTAPSERVLDVVGPSVSGVAIVSIPASGDAYLAADSEVIRVAVDFNEVVEVSTTIAGPSLTLTIGETMRAATYVPGLSEATTLVFAYALQAGDADADGISIEEDALVLAGAEITDLFGNPIENTSLGSHAILNAVGHQVIRTFRLFFDPPAVTLIRGGGAETVVLKIEPKLQASEEAVVDLGGPRGLTVNPARVTLTPTSNEADVTVAAESTAALGEAELSATFDAGASVLGNARVTADSLTVEVVLPAEASFEPDSLMTTTTEGAAAKVVVSLSRELSEDVTVAYRIEGHEADGYDSAEPADYSTPLGVVTVTIEAGATTAAIVIDINDDEEIEPTREAFKVVLEALPEGAFYTLASPDRTAAIVVITEGVCDRTPQVRDGILAKVSGVSDCAEVSDNDLSGVRETLDLGGRGIETLSAGDFSGLGNLGQLWLHENALTILPADVFSGLGSLEVLWLSFNDQLTTLPATVFSGLDKLEYLSLWDNQLIALPADVFKGLENLSTLVLSFNALTTLPTEVFSGLGKLELVYLNDNNLTTLPATVFSDLGSLETLFLHSNQLTALPVDVFSDLENLSTLALSFNALTTLPATVFSGLGNLEELYLYNNQLTALPESMFSGLGNLMILDLRANPGAPFVLARPRLEPTGTSPGPGVVEVKLVVDEPLPTRMTADLSAEGGVLSDSQAVIPGGSTESATFTVTQDAGASVVTLTASTGTLTGSFRGVVITPNELVLMSFIERVKLRIRVFLEGALE